VAEVSVAEGAAAVPVLAGKALTRSSSRAYQVVSETSYTK
jgi:hypothetical protein